MASPMEQAAAEHEDRRGGPLPDATMCTNTWDGTWCDSLAMTCCAICLRATCNKCIARWEGPNEDHRPEIGPHCVPVCNTCSWGQRYETCREVVAAVLNDREFVQSVNPEDEPWLALLKAQDSKHDYDNSVWVTILDTREGGEPYYDWAPLDTPFSATFNKYYKHANAEANDTVFFLMG